MSLKVCFCLSQFLLNASLHPYAVPQGKERHDYVFVLAPFSGGHGRDSSELRVVGWEGFASRPVVADEQDVTPMLDCREMGGICPVVGPIERHPGIWSSACHASILLFSPEVK